MDTIVKIIPCEVDKEQLFQKLHIKPDSRFVEKLDEMIEQALEVGKPKIAYKLSYVDEKGDDFVVVEKAKVKTNP
jgi:hypothetical protein